MTDLTKQLMCIQMRSGVEIWMEKDRVEQLQKILENIVGTKFINFDDQTINTADIVGIFSAENMSDFTNRKNGMWKCKHGTWHDRLVKCECLSKSDKDLIEKRRKAIENCPRKCKQGYLITTDEVNLRQVVTPCDCVKDIK